MRLNQRQIEVFNAIMMNKSITAAAVALGSSQPTISRELRDMEQRLGFDLFSRFGKRLTPTNQALLLQEIVRRSFIGLDEINRAASAIRMRNAASFRIATIPAYAEAIIPRVIPRFLKSRPSFDISVHSLEEQSLQHEITTTVFDLGLTEGLFDYQDVVSRSIDVGEMVCVLPQGHALAGRKVLEPADFASVPFISLSYNDPYRRKLDNIFFEAGDNRNYAIETTTSASVCAMVRAGVGLSIINPLTASNQIGTGIVFRKFGVSVPYKVSAWRPSNGHRMPLTERFITVLSEVTSEMSKALSSALNAS